MKGNLSQKQGKPSAATRAEAAAWIARLHGPNRTAKVEEACRRWMAEDPERARAFELLTDTWEKAGQLKVPTETLAAPRPKGFRMSVSRAAFATVAVVLVAVAATVFYLRTDGVSTVVGEQRTLTLEDGTRVNLNTNSHAKVHFDRQVRRVELEKGEALFEVARDPARPFIVTADGHEIRALGTSFIVRRDPRELAVTLVDGRVMVTPEGLLPLTQTPAQPAPIRPEIFMLNPGQRVTFASGAAAKVDRPSLEKVTAWRRGQISLDDTTLADTVSEMNRYSASHLVVRDPRVAAIRISGVFRAGDTENFLEAITRTYHLQVRHEGADSVLVAAPNTRGAD